jgi:CrcB protein
MINYLVVSFGAALGGGLRYWFSGFVYKFIPATFPYGTLIINVIGSFILGVVMFYLNEKELISHEVRLFLTVGFCGGFTTFSTFSYETINLIKDAQYMGAALNVILSVALSLLGIFLAYIISR